MPFSQVPKAYLTHSQKLSVKIRQAIKVQGGYLGFDAYMQMALYHPQMGYYAGALEKFGEQGDFITAPELGNLFGQCLAKQSAEVLAQLPGGEGRGSILEFGAGSGALAQSVLEKLAAIDALPKHYYILELSSHLRARQQKKLHEALGDLAGKVIWLDKMPENFKGVVLANEVLDAMPAKLFEQVSDEPGAQVIYELGVACVDEDEGDRSFEWQAKPADAALTAAVNALNIKTDARVYRSEINAQAQAWLKSLSESMQCGAVILIDYGFRSDEYYHADRSMGTLMCHFRHHAHDDPFYLPGVQDITAHVDFSAIAKAGQAAGFALAGYATQGAFLLSLGMLDDIEQDNCALDKDTQAQLGLAQEVKKLTMPHEMGELFKVLALTKNLGQNIKLSGFNMQDHRERL